MRKFWGLTSFEISRVLIEKSFSGIFDDDLSFEEIQKGFLEVCRQRKIWASSKYSNCPFLKFFDISETKENSFYLKSHNFLKENLLWKKCLKGARKSKLNEEVTKYGLGTSLSPMWIFERYHQSNCRERWLSSITLFHLKSISKTSPLILLTNNSAKERRSWSKTKFLSKLFVSKNSFEFPCSFRVQLIQ